jgi:SAM-dependent methyltransferase
MPQKKQSQWSSEWEDFAYKPDELAFLFSEWIYPNRLEDFSGRRVLDAGCGRGHMARLAASFATEVVGLDLNTAEIARRENRNVSNVRLVEGDIAETTFPEPFDCVYCVGVIHHTDNPDRSFENLKNLTRPGGRLIIWAYSHEGNFLNRAVVEPIKTIFLGRWSHSNLRRLSFALTALLYPFVWTIYFLPLRPLLPFYDYFANFRRLSFNQNLLNVFDKLNAPQTHFIKKEQISRWFNERDFMDVHISQYKGVSWRGSGTRR